MMVIDVDISRIVIKDRMRKEFGDLTSLVESIREIGLLHPVVVNPDFELIAGQRRLEACKLLGKSTIKAHMVVTLTDAASLIKAERDENVCRKDLTPEEAVMMGRQLEAMEIPKAKERRSEGGKRGLVNRHKPNEGNADLAEGNLPEARKSPQIREVVGEAVGMSGTIYHRAKAVVEAAEHDESLRPLVDEMNETGKVTGAYNKLTGKSQTKKRKDRREGTHRTNTNELSEMVKKTERLIGEWESLGQVKKASTEWKDEERWQFCDSLESLARILKGMAQELRHYSKRG